MEKYAILLGYFNKKISLINRLHNEIIKVDNSIYENRYLFALKTQQFYTAIVDLLKQAAKSFENNIDDLGSYHKALLVRMHTDIPNTRPAFLSKESYLLLDKIRSFRHFIRHAYDCELDENELNNIQNKIQTEFRLFTDDFTKFQIFVQKLA